MKHPGIWFTVISLTIVFFLPSLLGFVDWHPKIENSIIFTWGAFTVYGITVFNIRWIESNMRKQIEKDRKNDSRI